MDLKIFPVGFSEQDFNDFCQVNIIYKYHVIDNGSIFVFYKNIENIGKTKIETIEDLDRITKQAQVEILAYRLDKTQIEAEVLSFKEEINKFHTNQSEWVELDKKIKGKELQIKMADETIKDRELKVTNSETMLKEVMESKK